MGGNESDARSAVGRVSDNAGLAADATVADIGERALIALLTRMSEQAVLRDEFADDALVVGPGDDAAVLAMAGPLVVSTDSLVQDRHFRFSWSTPEQIGARAAIQSAADVAAMGARCVGIVVSVACPPTTLAAVVLGINQGMNDAAAAFGARVVGGDLVSADEMVVTVTSFGTTDGRPAIRLGGAEVGETLALSGPVGSSAAGLALLAVGNSEFPDLIAAHQVPVVDLRHGLAAAAAGAHAMTDVSDGLADELDAIATASGVAVEIRTADLPAHAVLYSAADALGVEVAQWQIGGGEDHQLLASFAGAPPAGWSAIGTVVTAESGPRVRFDGVASSIRGWQSF